MKSIQKYLKKKAADGTVSKIAVATLLLFNLAYFISLSISQAGKKVDFNFFKDVTDPRTYSYAIASSIILAVLVSSLIFHKIKTKRLSYKDNWDFDDKVEKLLSDDTKKDKMKKVTIKLDHKGLMIMPGKNVIEIPVLHYDTADQELEGGNKSSIFEGVTFTAPSFWSSKNKSIYPEVIGSEKVWETIVEINRSKIEFFSYDDFFNYQKSGFTLKYENSKVMFENNTDENFIKNGRFNSVTIKPTKFFKFTDLYNISSIKFHYADCSSTEVKLKLKEKQAADMKTQNKLLDYVHANRRNMLPTTLKEPQVAFISAIAGGRPVFDGKVL